MLQQRLHPAMQGQVRRLHALPCSTAASLRSVRLTCRCEKDTKTTLKKSSSSSNKQLTQLTPTQLQDQQKQVRGQQQHFARLLALHCCLQAVACSHYAKLACIKLPGSKTHIQLAYSCAFNSFGGVSVGWLYCRAGRCSTGRRIRCPGMYPGTAKPQQQPWQSGHLALQALRFC